MMGNHFVFAKDHLLVATMDVIINHSVTKERLPTAT